MTFGSLSAIPAEAFDAPARRPLDQQHAALQGAAERLVATAGIEIAVEVLFVGGEAARFCGREMAAPCASFRFPFAATTFDWGAGSTWRDVAAAVGA